MSKYTKLWEFLKNEDIEKCILSFDKIEKITGIPIDHSFLKYKKELNDYGYNVSKISLKKKEIIFEKIKEEVS